MDPQATLNDVSKYESADTAVLTFKNERGDDDLIGADGTNPAKAVMYSPGSEQGRKALLKAGRPQQLRMFRSMRGEILEQDSLDAERERIQKLTSFTAELINFPGTPSQLYSNPRLYWMHDQADTFITKPANFMKASSKSLTSP